MKAIALFTLLLLTGCMSITVPQTDMGRSEWCETRFKFADQAEELHKLEDGMPHEYFFLEMGAIKGRYDGCVDTLKKLKGL